MSFTVHRGDAILSCPPSPMARRALILFRRRQDAALTTHFIESHCGEQRRPAAPRMRWMRDNCLAMLPHQIRLLDAPTHRRTLHANNARVSVERCNPAFLSEMAHKTQMDIMVACSAAEVFESGRSMMVIGGHMVNTNIVDISDLEARTLYDYLFHNDAVAPLLWSRGDLA